MNQTDAEAYRMAVESMSPLSTLAFIVFALFVLGFLWTMAGQLKRIANLLKVITDQLFELELHARKRTDRQD